MEGFVSVEIWCYTTIFTCLIILSLRGPSCGSFLLRWLYHSNHTQVFHNLISARSFMQLVVLQTTSSDFFGKHLANRTLAQLTACSFNQLYPSYFQVVTMFLSKVLNEGTCASNRQSRPIRGLILARADTV